VRAAALFYRHLSLAATQSLAAPFLAPERFYPAFVAVTNTVMMDGRRSARSIYVLARPRVSLLN
jgi:hypothetical protein